MSWFWLKIIASIIFVLVPGFSLTRNLNDRPLLTGVSVAVGLILFGLAIWPIFAEKSTSQVQLSGEIDDELNELRQKIALLEATDNEAPDRVEQLERQIDALRAAKNTDNQRPAAIPLMPSAEQSSRKKFALMFSEQPLTWYEAKLEAERNGGQLASISSAAEQDEVWELVKSQTRAWVVNSSGYHIGPWLGGFQQLGSREPDGGWQWLDNRSMGYTNWSRSSDRSGRQPNNASGIEEALVFMGLGQRSPKWNDYPSSPSGFSWQAKISAFVVEFP